MRKIQLPESITIYLIFLKVALLRKNNVTKKLLCSLRILGNMEGNLTQPLDLKWPIIT